MTRIILCVMIAMVLTSAAIADDRTVALEYERKLDKHITLSLRAATLKEVLAEVEKATGVHLLVDREIADDKATVYVKDQPAQDVLRALAHCFNLGWSPSPRTADKPYLRLWMDRDYISSMSDREYRDYLSIVGQFDKEVKETAEYVRMGTQTTGNRAEIDKLSGGDKVLWVRLYKRGEITASAPRGAMVLQFLALSDKQKQSLYAGDHVSVSAAEISAETLKKWPEAKSFDYAIDRTSSGCVLRCAGRPGAGTYNISTAYFDNSPYEKAADLAAKKILEDTKLDKALPEGTKFATDAAVRLGEGSASTPGTMSDGLLELAGAANIPVVAQYVSEYSGASVDWDKQTIRLPASSAKKVGQRLAELGKQHTFAVVCDGEFLLGKSLLWHRQRLAEVPEAKVRTWQRNCCGLAAPTFKTFVDMASTRWEQVRGTMNNTGFWLGDWYMLSLVQCEYALRLFGTLTQDQQQWLLSGRELPVATLTPEQQMCFMCGYEVREKPTFENAADQDWPKTASISFHDVGFGDTGFRAIVGMKTLSMVTPENGAFVIPNGSSRGQAAQIIDACMTRLQSSLMDKLRTQVAKDHPEIPAKDVSYYVVRHGVFVLKLGDKTRRCELYYSEKAP